MKNARKRYAAFVCAALLLAGLFGCGPNAENSFSEGLFAEYSVSPAYGDFTTMYTVHIAAYSDGRVVVSAEPYLDYSEPPPAVTLQKTPQQVEALQAALIGAGCFKLPENADTESADGAYHTIVIHTAADQLTSSGLNPTDARFCAVAELLSDYAGGALAELDALMDGYFLEHSGEVWSFV